MPFTCGFVVELRGLGPLTPCLQVRPAPVRCRARGSGPSCPASYGETPCHPVAYGPALPRSFSASPGATPRPMHECGQGQMTWRAEGVPLKT